MRFQLYKYTSQNVWSQLNDELLQTVPFEIDYKTGLKIRLQKKETFFKGELRKVEYFEKYDITTNTYSIPVIVEDIEYFRTKNLFSYKRITKIRWFYEDGTLCDEIKELEKFYSHVSSRNEIMRRRKNNIANITIMLIYFIETHDGNDDTSLNDARAFAKDLSFEISEYVEIGLDDLMIRLREEVADENSSHAFLKYKINDTMSIADYLIEELTI